MSDVPSWLQLFIGITVSLAVIWLMFLVVLWSWERSWGQKPVLKEMLRLMPDVLRLVRRLASDSTLTWGIRVRLFLLLAYLIFPIDLVPDFIPVLGYADDAIVVAIVLRSVVRKAGKEALIRHWPGSPQGLALVFRLVGLTEQ